MIAVSNRTPLPGWAVMIGLLALSPLPLALPSGLALAAIGLLGSALLLRNLGRDRYPLTLAPHGSPTVAALNARADDVAAVNRMGSDAG